MHDVPWFFEACKGAITMWGARTNEDKSKMGKEGYGQDGQGQVKGKDSLWAKWPRTKMGWDRK